ncbi:MAG: response regulator [Rhodospirillaceae bacterium]|nr:response regulator [Rhodospirillaceae bacterium]
MIIDDRQEMASALGAMLEGAGYRTVIASDGKKGLAALRDEAIGLVVTDIAMPGEDGFGILRALASLPRRIPAIAMSGNARRWPFDLGRFSALLGADAFLSKPFAPELFLDSVRRLLPPRRPAPPLQAAA